MTRASTPAFGVGTIVAVLALLLSSGVARARQATPETEGLAAPHPIHIHSGSCEELGEVVYPLNDVAMQEGEVVGFPGPSLVATSFTTVDASLETILASPHAINAHLSAAEIGTYIACGNVGGVQRPDGGIPIELREIDGSGVQGIAYLAPNATNPAQTDVSVFLAEAVGVEEDGELPEDGIPPAAGTPEVEDETTVADAEQVVEVALTEFDILMEETVAAGPTLFRVTNTGTVEHNFEIEGQGIEREFEENLQPGEVQSMTVDLEPGTYTIYCPVGNHREEGMELQLTVTE